MATLDPRRDPLEEFERILDSFYRRDPVEDANAAVRRAVEEYNVWVESATAEANSASAALEASLAPLRQTEARIAETDARLEREAPDGRDPNAVEAYNRLVCERNALAGAHGDAVEAFQRDQEAHNARVGALNQEIAERKAGVDSVRQEAETRVQAYRQWVESRSGERLSADLNRYYATLHLEARRTGQRSPDWERRVGAARGLRAELGAAAAREQERRENGLMIVTATLSGGEECRLIVDVGASIVTLTPELVQVLGIEEHVGEEEELSLAGGIRIRAPQLLIPSLGVGGVTTEWVPGVVLAELMPGVDGCLGLSFLNRFDYRITRGRPGTLTLNPPVRDSQAPGFDVFISHKSQDYPHARAVYDALTEAGYRAFLSEVSLEESGETHFARTIDAALEGTHHLVVVGSRREYLEAPWVEAEWRMFVNMQRSGVKRGNLLTVVCGMDVTDLPMTLRQYQAITLGDPEFRTRLVRFLPRA